MSGFQRESNTDAAKAREQGLRFARRVYLLRALGLAFGAVCIASVLWQNGARPAAWIALAANGFLWPHLAYQIARRSRNPYRTELRNLTGDSAFGGAWVPLMDFNLLPSVLLLVMLSVDKVNVGGVKLLARCAAAQLAAGVASALAFGFELRPESTMLNVVAGLPLLIGYPMMIEFASHRLARQAREQNRRLAAFRELLLEAIPLPVFYRDALGRYTGCNGAFTRFIGKTRDDVVGKTVYEVSPQILAQTDPDKDLDLLEGPVDTQVYENRVIHGDGTARDVIFHRARISDDAGRPTGIIGVITDITEIRRMEAARDELEGQLRESQKMEALGTLAGGVAHDFNNIIAAILGNTELACQEVGPGHKAQGSLEEIRKASRRARELVQQILAFSRRQSLERKVISLAPVVQDATRLLRATLPPGVSLSVECAPDVPVVLADATQIAQVLLNLGNNAWQAMQGRPGAIEVRLEAYDRAAGELRDTRATGILPGRYACLTVRDNGSGMDQATRARIFEPFFTTKPVGKGTGLGLAGVHGIVQIHGGSIDVRSAPGEGAAFHIYFPAVDALVPATPGQGSHPMRTDNAEMRALEGQGKHILYVDDDESIVYLMTRLLERRSYRVSGYTDAREALAAASADPGGFDLAVTDYTMPGMSGLDVARALREIRADLPVAVASGYITEELREKAPAAGISELIYKPNDIEDLCEAVARLASTSRGK